MKRRARTALRRCALAAFLAIATVPASAREAASPAGYGVPSAEIVQALEARPTPIVEPSPGGRFIALLFRRAMPPIAELARPAIGLAGQSIDPANNGPARGIRFDRIVLLSPTGAEAPLALPPDARISTVRWSPDGSRIAFLDHADDTIALWVANAETGRTRRIVRDVNAGFAEPYAWLPDGSGFLVRLVPPGRGAPPPRPPVPSRPEIRVSDGRAAPAQTLSNLLENAHDDALFRHYFTAQLALVPLDGSPPRPLGAPAIVCAMSVAPGGGHVLVERLREPFSRAFAAPDFPREIVVLDVSGGEAHRIAALPGADRAGQLPDGADPGPRAMAWRPDEPATLVWAEADTASGAARDRLYRWRASSEEAEAIAAVEGRVVRVEWASPDLALIAARAPEGGGLRRIPFDPGKPVRALSTAGLPPVDHGLSLLSEGGSERLALSAAGLPLALDDAGGATADRILALDPLSGAQEVLHTFPSGGRIQRIAAVLDPRAGAALAWREDATHPPNLYLLRAGSGATRLTAFGDPAPAYAGMRMMRLTYRRADGAPLSAKLYLPAALANAPPRPLPTLLWAYPVRRTSPPAERAPRGAVTPVVWPGGLDRLLLTASGYAVLIADMPIVAREGGAAHDFERQLVANSAAAIDAAVASGWVDRRRIAVAGHSFGAGMAANLLANSDLFAAGIALSGAYNRTLTPFGFQTERRSLWEAPEIYRAASPFLRADAIEAPLLLIHGARDANSGAQPMQSERMFAALRGLGKRARFVLLPGEGHSYAARESVLHAMYEIERWLALHLAAEE